MVASGLPERNGILHASEVALMSLELLDLIQNFTSPINSNEKLSLRIGLHSGAYFLLIVFFKVNFLCI